MMKRALLGAVATLSLVAASPAAADPVQVRDGKFDAVVSANQMSRISIPGDRIASVRSIGEPDGPQMLVEAEAPAVRVSAHSNCESRRPAKPSGSGARSSTSRTNRTPPCR